MNTELSSNTQAILLLTAPLIIGCDRAVANPLSPGEYKKLARGLRELKNEPADLLGAGAREVLETCPVELDRQRLEALLGRGFLLSQAMERWRSRAMWVVSRADPGYPQRLKKRLGESAPAVLYGCGDPAILNTGGLAVVGSRKVDDDLVEYTEGVGRLTAKAGRTVVSGGARGIDQAAMRGALQAGGCVTGALADGLEKAVMVREHRDALIDGRLVLVCPYDPAARFHVGHAMQRNKLIYALSDAALVVSSDYNKGGTWTGAIEQLDKLRLVPVYVRSTGAMSKGLDALRQRGAVAWREPETRAALEERLGDPAQTNMTGSKQAMLQLEVREEVAAHEGKPCSTLLNAQTQTVSEATATPADELLAKVQELIGQLDGVNTEAEVAEALQVSKNQARDWLQRLVEKGVLEKLTRPVRYQRVTQLGSLFGKRD